MKPPILNREFKHPADGWYQIEPKGFHPNKAAKIVQVIDDKAINSIVTNFNRASAAAELKHGKEMLVDQEHFRHNPEKETRAFAWTESLQARPDGIYATNRWTPIGKAAVDGGEYRFFSTEYDLESNQFELVEPSQVPADIRNRFKDFKFIRPLVLTGLTLTNDFNNLGQKPATNRNALPDNPVDTPTREQVDIQNRKIQTMKSIATKLGLSAEASEDAIVGEITKLMNRATTAEAALAPLTTERDQLKNRVTTIEDNQAEADLDAAGIAKDHADRPEMKKTLLANRDGGLALLKMVKGKTTEKSPVLHNRQGAGTPSAIGGGGETKTVLRNRAVADYRASHNNCDFEPAWDAVRSAKPELFTDEE